MNQVDKNIFEELTLRGGKEVSGGGGNGQRKNRNQGGLQSHSYHRRLEAVYAL